MKNTVMIIVLLSMVAVAAVIIFVIVEVNEDTESPLDILFSSISNPIYYPNTVAAPVLELTWDGELDPSAATRYTPYGVWEGQFEYAEGIAYEPANEMQFYVITEVSNLLAVSPGIVTQSETFGGGVGLVSVQYGQNYAVTYLHVIPKEGLKIGQQIETGDVLGTMEKKIVNQDYGEETWWEIMLTTHQDGKFRTLPPYDYFSDDGKAKLDSLTGGFREAAYFDSDGNSLWTISEGCSWLPYSPDGWWDSGRFFDQDRGETQAEFIDNLDLGWTIGDDNGRIIGPSDDCNL